MFKFLRFEIGGLAVVFWGVVCLFPVVNIQQVFSIGVGEFFVGFFGSLIISLPLGNYVHQLTDSLFSPYLRRRARFFKRKSTANAETIYPDICEDLNDKSYQLLHVLSQSIEYTIQDESNSASILKIDVVRESIRSRYSYFYARIEAGFVSPIVGALVAFLIYTSSTGNPIFNTSTNYPVIIMSILFIVVSTGMLWRVPQLFSEIDDLESGLLKINEKAIKGLLVIN